MSNYDFLIIGGGIFGVSAAVELKKRKYSVGLINPDAIPHPLAASTDISKAVRMEYGSDAEYFDMAELSIQRWKEWNELFGLRLYHEVGFLMLCKGSIDSDRHSFEKHSYLNLKKKKYPTELLNAAEIKRRFPAVNSDVYIEANYNPIGGYVESGLAVETLAKYARQLGVEIHEGQTADSFEIKHNRLMGVKTREGRQFSCGQAIVAAGAATPYLLPELQPFMKTTGHPVFHIKPSRPELFKAPQMAVFTADISNSGWYGFPLHAKQGVVKAALHSNGQSLDPERDNRRVSDAQIKILRSFLKETFPTLADDPLVYTRICLYTDTLDGHFWIDQHPQIEGLSVSSGGSGHGMKMGPMLGEMTADMAEGKSNRFSQRYRWRRLGDETLQVEEARHVTGRKLALD